MTFTETSAVSARSSKLLFNLNPRFLEQIKAGLNLSGLEAGSIIRLNHAILMRHHIISIIDYDKAACEVFLGQPRVDFCAPAVGLIERANVKVWSGSGYASPEPT